MDFASRSALEAYAELPFVITEALVRPLAGDGAGAAAADLLRAWGAAMASDATKWQARQERYLREQHELWQRHIGAARAADARAPAPGPDPRFRDEGWRLPYFAYLAEAYLLARRWIEESIGEAPLDERRRRRLAFFARQYLDAVAPANYFWSNPEAVKLALRTGGASVAAGLNHLREDLPLGRVSNVDRSAFEIGTHLAVTPGAVIYENRLMQVIQYRAATDRVYDRPLLIVPPCINKYYILDLRPENSFVRHAVSRGHTVFMISWRNVTPALGDLRWDDYLSDGVTTALRVAREVCGVAQVNALGFCVGGTLLASALAVLVHRGERPARSLTLLTTLLDYADTGELGLFVDESSVARREQALAEGGVLKGDELAAAFASLRANQLVWRYVVNNYLLGRKPEAFDLLYWNDDSTNLAGPMYTYYLRNMYLENRLREPCRLTMCGAPVDLGALELPTYAVAAREDHIVPWKAAYSSAALLGGKIEFVLTASGHIAGIVNPPPGRRRRYWSGPVLTADGDSWLSSAASRDGSWWPHWSRWIARHAGRRREARLPGTARYPQIEPAPGRYVRASAVAGAGAAAANTTG